jgi:hypothetical protein
MPALAIATRLSALRPDIDPVLVGALRGIEAQILPTRPFRHYLLPIEPLYRRQWWKNFRWPLIVGRLHRELGRLFDRERPAAVLGTGVCVGPECLVRRPAGYSDGNSGTNAVLAWRPGSGWVRHVYLGMRGGHGCRELRRGLLPETVTPPTPGARRSSGRALRGERVVLVTGRPGCWRSARRGRMVAGRWLGADNPLGDGCRVVPDFFDTTTPSRSSTSSIRSRTHTPWRTWWSAEPG